MRRNLLMLLAMSLWSVWMMLSATFQLVDSPKVAGIELPGVAMQFSQSDEDVTGLLGKPDPRAAIDNRQIMREQQYLDFVFMAFYWMVFVFVLSEPMRQSARGRSATR